MKINNPRSIAATVVAAAALALAGCATGPGYGSSSGGGYVNQPAYGSSQGSCQDCGTVVRIEHTGSTGSNVPNATGAVLGGVVGAVAGRELGHSKSTGKRNTATVAGAAAGALAGNAIQNKVQGDSYRVHVRMDNGRTVVLDQRDVNGMREGSYVRVYGGAAHLR